MGPAPLPETAKGGLAPPAPPLKPHLVNVQEVEHFFNLQKYIPRRFIGCFASSLKLFLFSLVDSSLFSLLRIIQPIITSIYCLVWITSKVVFDYVECALYIVIFFVISVCFKSKLFILIILVLIFNVFWEYYLRNNVNKQKFLHFLIFQPLDDCQIPKWKIF